MTTACYHVCSVPDYDVLASRLVPDYNVLTPRLVPDYCVVPDKGY